MQMGKVLAAGAHLADAQAGGSAEVGVGGQQVSDGEIVCSFWAAAKKGLL